MTVLLSIPAKPCLSTRQASLAYGEKSGAFFILTARTTQPAPQGAQATGGEANTAIFDSKFIKSQQQPRGDDFGVACTLQQSGASGDFLVGKLCVFAYTSA
jgi:hypothetical protein